MKYSSNNIRNKTNLLFSSVIVCTMASPSASAAVCDDPDGDGWGWDGQASCQVTESGDCDDPDGDGWGWNGQASCQVGEPEPAQVTRPTTGRCEDPDGDGWGWNGEDSCKVVPAAFKPLSWADETTTEMRTVAAYKYEAKDRTVLTNANPDGSVDGSVWEYDYSQSDTPEVSSHESDHFKPKEDASAPAITHVPTSGPDDPFNAVNQRADEIATEIENGNILGIGNDINKLSEQALTASATSGDAGQQFAAQDLVNELVEMAGDKHAEQRGLSADEAEWEKKKLSVVSFVIPQPSTAPTIERVGVRKFLANLLDTLFGTLDEGESDPQTSTPTTTTPPGGGGDGPSHPDNNPGPSHPTTPGEEVVDHPDNSGTGPR